MMELILELEYSLRHAFDRCRYYDDYPKTKEDAEHTIQRLLQIVEDLRKSHRLGEM